MHRQQRAWMLTLGLTGALVVGCAGGAAVTTAPSEVAATAASVAPSPSTEAEATTRAPVAVTPVAVTPVATPEPTPCTAAETWDLLWVSDSTGSGGVPQAYADRIAAERGVCVRVVDAWTADLQARLVLDRLSGDQGGVLHSTMNGDVNLPEAVQDAEVIVISGNAAGSPTKGYDAPGCPLFFDPLRCPAAPDCTQPAMAQYEADLGAIFDKVFELRGGRPVVLRTHDWYTPPRAVSAWGTCKILDPCEACDAEVSAAVHRVAGPRGIPVAPYFETFGGDPANPMPRDLTWDAVHPSAKGATALAGLMAGLGYDPVKPAK